MRAITYDGKLKYVDDYPDPVPDHDNTLIRVKYAGVCDTDVQIAQGYMDFSGVLGHEFVGTVVGPLGTELLGQRVVGEINCPCGDCELCRRGLGKHCRSRTVLGIAGRDGCFADYVDLPEKNLHAVLDSIRDETAVFAEPLAAALNVLQETHVRSEDRVAVLGDGKLGILTAQTLALTGADVTIVGRHPERAGLIDEVGSPIPIVTEVEAGNDYDVAVDASGSAEGLATSISLVRPGGTVVMKTTVAGEHALDLAPLVIDEIKLVGNRCGPFGPALRLLESGFINPEPLIERIIKPEEAVAVIEGGVPGLKYVVDFGGS
jgi:alcohol dehydrogenase